MYYLLGGGKEQLAVWHGQEIWTNTACQNLPVGSVAMYPVEYNSYVGGLARVSTNVTQAPEGLKLFHIADHLGSVRVSLDSVGRLTQLDYEPFGAVASMTQLGADVPRQTFIDKEKDAENGLGDFGVRKYEEETGRFLSVDPLWENYASLAPYSYCANDPARGKDPTGEWILFTGSDRAEGERLFLIALEYLESHDATAGKELRAAYEDKSFDDPTKGFMLYTYSEGAQRPTNQFDPINNEIQWDPYDALVYTDVNGKTQRLSPATNLAHEWGHKNLFERDRANGVANSKKNAVKREKEVMRKYEGNAALKTGEVKNGKQLRRNHTDGSLDRVSSPDTNR